MPSFAFSLQRVLDYRRLEEGWAQDAHRAAREAREAVETEIDTIRLCQETATQGQASTLAARLDLEAYLSLLEREESEAQVRLAQRLGEQERAAEEWRAARTAAEALEKLRENALDEWRAEEARREQADLDEWAVLRR